MIFKAVSKLHGDIILKFIPPYINRYEKEKAAYLNLSSHYMCKVIHFNDNLNLLILENNGEIIQIDPKSIKLLKDFFSIIFKIKRSMDISFDYNSNFNDYYKILKQKLNKRSHFFNLIKEAISLYDVYFKEDRLYVIHGDLHRFNITVNKNNEVKAIDPIGYIAPLEFEAARFIGTELEEMYSKYNLKEILDFWIEFFGNFNLNEKRLIIALFIDIIFRLDNSTIEESDFTRTNRWINILNEIFYRKNKLKFLE